MKLFSSTLWVSPDPLPLEVYFSGLSIMVLARSTLATLNEPHFNTKIRESKAIFDNPKKMMGLFPEPMF